MLQTVAGKRCGADKCVVHRNNLACSSREGKEESRDRRGGVIEGEEGRMERRGGGEEGRRRRWEGEEDEEEGRKGGRGGGEEEEEEARLDSYLFARQDERKTRYQDIRTIFSSNLSINRLSFLL